MYVPSALVYSISSVKNFNANCIQPRASSSKEKFLQPTSKAPGKNTAASSSSTFVKIEAAGSKSSSPPICYYPPKLGTFASRQATRTAAKTKAAKISVKKELKEELGADFDTELELAEVQCEIEAIKQELASK